MAGEGDDVCAGDLARAVGRRQLLRVRVRRAVVQENGGVAALKKLYNRWFHVRSRAAAIRSKQAKAAETASSLISHRRDRTIEEQTGKQYPNRES